MKKIILTTLIAFASFLTSEADWIIKSVSRSEGSEYYTTMYVRHDYMRIETEGFAMIFDLKNKELIYINPTSKSYWKGNQEDIKKEVEEYTRKMMIEAMGEEAYNEYKKNMESMEEDTYGDDMEEINIVDEGITEQINGYKGKKYSIYMNGELTEELWICEDIRIMDDFNYKEFDALLDEEDGSGYESSKEYDELMSKGYPIKEISYSYGEVMDVSELVSAEETSIPDEKFAIPSGYQQTALMDLLTKAMGGMDER